MLNGKDQNCIPAVFYVTWPDDLKAAWNSDKINNSELEIVAVLLLYGLRLKLYDHPLKLHILNCLVLNEEEYEVQFANVYGSIDEQ